jgi:hypothetical protein
MGPVSGSETQASRTASVSDSETFGRPKQRLLLCLVVAHVSESETILQGSVLLNVKPAHI